MTEYWILVQTEEEALGLAAGRVSENIRDMARAMTQWQLEEDLLKNSRKPLAKKPRKARAA